jgi:hypothetical protein
MYATPYVHPDGFGSVGFLSDIREDSITVADPIFGTLIVRPDDCFGVISTETGSVLPATRPILIASPTSSHLMPGPARMVANEAKVIMLRPRHFEGEEFPSGYPHAWEIIRRWREGVAPDWRTIALSAIFARFSIQRPIEEAEMLYRKFGPTIRASMLRGALPSEAQLLHFKGIKDTRAVRLRKKGKRKGEYSWDDVPAILDIFEWAPWVAEQAQSKVYTRKFRDNIAIEWAPRGLGIAKISFTMMLMGRDAACVDTRIQRLFFGEYTEEFEDASFDVEALEEEEEPEGGATPRTQWMSRVSRRSRAKGSRGVSRPALTAYTELEDKFKDTPYFDPEWPMPFAKAQWMMWETLGRTATTANHDALWEVIGPLIEDIDAGR